MFLGGSPQGPGFLFLLLSLLCFLKFLIYPLDALGPRRAPTFLLLQKSRQKTGAREFHPLANPRTKVGCWTPPFGNPQVLAGAVNLAELLAASRLELRCRWGRPRARARSPPLPHLHRFGFGGCAPLPPRFPKGKVCRSCAPVGGFGPLAPAFPKRERLPIMRASAWDRVRNGFCGNAFANLRGSSCREAARSSVTPLARLCRRHSSATASGESQRGRSPLWPVFAYFLLARK